MARATFDKNIFLKLSRFEIFMPVQGFESYEVSNFGRIRHIKKDGSIVMLQPYNTDARGYKKITLWNSGRKSQQYVHRLVAKAFVAGYKEGLTVNHIDEVKGNNNFLNLEWLTIGENVRYSQLGKPKPRKISK